MQACEDKYTVRIKTQFDFYGSFVYVFFKVKANKYIVLFECYADKLLQIFNCLITCGKGRIRQICIVWWIFIDINSWTVHIQWAGTYIPGTERDRRNTLLEYWWQKLDRHTLLNNFSSFSTTERVQNTFVNKILETVDWKE